MKTQFPIYVWFHSVWGQPIVDGGKILKAIGFYQKSEKHALEYEFEDRSTANVTDCNIITQVYTREECLEGVKASLEKAADQLMNDTMVDEHGRDYILKSSITNPENIVLLL